MFVLGWSQPSILMLFSRNGRGHSSGLLVASLTDISPAEDNAEAGPALLVLTIARHTSATTIRELRRNKVYYSHVLEGTSHVLDHLAMSRGQGGRWERENECVGLVLLVNLSFFLCSERIRR